MVKSNRSGSRKVDPSPTQRGEKRQEQPVSQPATTMPAGPKKSKTDSRGRVGGTAVQGAKSTQPKELSTGKPADQQPEYYNRETRRRMQQMNTGPYTERASVDPRERRRKRQERLNERQDQMKQLVDARGPSRDIRLGRRNAYFLIGTAVLLIILFVVFIILRHPF